MEEISEALMEAGYVVFLAAGVKLNEDEQTYWMRCGADANIVRCISEGAWQTMRATLIREIDMLRNAPLDDLTRA